jgi:nickel-dependent lactate racemase
MRELLTAAWYDERALALDLPPAWEVTVHWPGAIPTMTDAQIADALERPVDQPPVRELCERKSRPLVIVDDLTRQPRPFG